jgi:hypothetical protein
VAALQARACCESLSCGRRLLLQVSETHTLGVLHFGCTALWVYYTVGVLR